MHLVWKPEQQAEDFLLTGEKNPSLRCQQTPLCPLTTRRGLHFLLIPFSCQFTWKKSIVQLAVCKLTEKYYP